MDISLSASLTMKPLQDSDAQVLFTVVDTNRHYLRTWMSWVEDTTTPADSEIFLQCITQQFAKGLSQHFAIFSEGQLCGVCGFNKLDTKNKIGTIGYWLIAPFTGNGIMTQCVSTLLNIGFYERNLHKIEIHCAEHNHKSRAIPERLGFLHEATLRDCEWLYDRYEDHAVYTLLSSEYRPNPLPENL
ncbi:GNAT family protein [Gilvimarinus japonicus]